MRMTLEEYMDKKMNIDVAFIGVDIQNDFGHPKGSLYVKGGEELVNVAVGIVENFAEGLVFWTKDRHPDDHCSFLVNGGIWPVHCVKGKWGNNFLRGLPVDDGDTIIFKGEDSNVDFYRAFFDKDSKKETELKTILQEEEVTQLFVMGLATDYCVKFTVLDALKLGFEVAVYLDGCRGVELNNGDIEKAIMEMENAGAIIIEN